MAAVLCVKLFYIFFLFSILTIRIAGGIEGLKHVSDVGNI